MVRIPTHRSPTHPGEMLQEEFLAPLSLSPKELAERIHVAPAEIDELLAERGSVTPRLALRLGRVFGMSAEFWLNLQLRWELFHAQRAEADELERIHTLEPQLAGRQS